MFVLCIGKFLHWYVGRIWRIGLWCACPTTSNMEKLIESGDWRKQEKKISADGNVRENETLSNANYEERKCQPMQMNTVSNDRIKYHMKFELMNFPHDFKFTKYFRVFSFIWYEIPISPKHFTLQTMYDVCNVYNVCLWTGHLRVMSYTSHECKLFHNTRCLRDTSTHCICSPFLPHIIACIRFME